MQSSKNTSRSPRLNEYLFIIYNHIIPMKQKQQNLIQKESIKQFENSFKSYSQQLFPSCSISTFLKIHSPQSVIQHQKEKKATKEESSSKYYPSPNIELDHTKPNRLVFHHYQKFNTFQFQFDHIYHRNAANRHLSKSIDLYSSLIEQNQNICILVMGGRQSGMQSLCQGSDFTDNEGLFFTTISQFWNKIKNESLPSVNSIRIILKCIVASDEKMFDLLSPKNQIHIKDLNGKAFINGCSTYQIKSLYDFHKQLQQIYEQKRLLFGQCIMVIQSEIIVSKESHYITDEDLTSHFFTFIQWEKSTSDFKKFKQNYNKSLLTLNMCIYQLYKISCHPPKNIGLTELKKLWSNFRNSSITMIMKYYFMANNRIVFVGCVSLKESEQQENYQILMVGKNLAKVTKLAKINCKPMNKPLKATLLSHKMKTEPTESSSIQKSPNIDYLSVLKDNLKKILKQKEDSEEIQEKKEQIVDLFKIQKQKRRVLENIRYKRQQMKILQDYKKINKVSSSNNSRIIHSKDENKLIILPTLQLKKKGNLQDQELINLSNQQQRTKKQIETIHEQIMMSIQSQSNKKLTKNVLEMEIRLHEKEMIQFIGNKNKIVNLLKNQIQSITNQEKQQTSTMKTKKSKNVSQQRVKAKSRNLQDYRTLIPKQDQETSVNPEGWSEKKQSSQPKEIFKIQNLKRINKNNYHFEKRRLLLKQKLSKGREEVNQFYEQAAKKFQQYRPK